MYSFKARLKNISGQSLTGYFYAPMLAEITKLTGGHLLKNGNYGPRSTTFKYVDEIEGFSDMILDPGESVRVLFELCLKQQEPFQFLVDVWGVVMEEE